MVKFIVLNHILSDNSASRNIASLVAFPILVQITQILPKDAESHLELIKCNIATNFGKWKHLKYFETSYLTFLCYIRAYQPPRCDSMRQTPWIRRANQVQVTS